jgi:hypothetical protein
VVIIEIDEHGHVGYIADCELARLDVLAFGADELYPTYLLRLNTHGKFVTNGELVTLEDRIKVSAEMLRRVFQEEIELQVGLNIQYLFYEKDNKHFVQAESKPWSLTLFPTINDKMVKYSDDKISKFKIQEVLDEQDTVVSDIIETMLASHHHYDQCEAVVHPGDISKRTRCVMWKAKDSIYCRNHTGKIVERWDKERETNKRNNK